MPFSLSPFDGRYTRQQVSEATDLEVDVLSYWIKEGLLKAAEGEGLGRGKHRLFGFEAIHIAAVLKELGCYGVQVGGLRQVSELLWGGFLLGSPRYYRRRASRCIFATTR